MIYFTTPDEKHVVILGLADLNVIRRGNPIASPDCSVLLCYTHDIYWFRDELVKVFNQNERTLSPGKLDELLREGLKRPVRQEG